MSNQMVIALLGWGIGFWCGVLSVWVLFRKFKREGPTDGG